MKVQATFLAIGISVLWLVIFAFSLLIFPVLDEISKIVNNEVIMVGDYFLISLYATLLPLTTCCFTIFKTALLLFKKPMISHQLTVYIKIIYYLLLIITGVFVSNYGAIYVIAQHEDAPGIIIIWTFIVGLIFTITTITYIVYYLFNKTIKTDKGSTVLSV